MEEETKFVELNSQHLNSLGSASMHIKTSEVMESQRVEVQS